jgi:hypothetical protein
MEERHIRFGVLLSVKERQALARLAEAAGGLPLGAMVRNLIRKEAGQRGVWPSDGVQCSASDQQRSIAGSRDEWSDSR